jgi:hypothetical protein
VSKEDTQRAANAGVQAAAAGAKGAAVVVVVRELDGSLSVASNIVGDRVALLRILKEGGDAIRGQGLVIV